MDFDQTQVLALDEYEDETDDEITQSQNAPVAHIKVPCQKGVPEKNYPLYEGNNVIGRQESCNIHIPSKALSKQHACIEIRGDSHLLYDCESRNRTRRGKLFLSPNVRYELKHKDSLTFADVHTTYVIEKEVSRVDESGSETGSESMLQTVKIDESTVLDETREDEDEDASDASSDILQPTQPSSSSQMWKNSRMLEATQNFANGAKGDDINGNMTVQETPAGKKDQSGDLSTLMLPESDTEEDSPHKTGNPQATLVFEDEKDTSGDQDILVAATQAFPAPGDSDEDYDDEEESKKALLCAPTQAFDAGDIGTDTEEVDLDAPTLAVVANSDSEDEAPEIDVNAATQAVVMDTQMDDEDTEEETKTVAYEMEVEDKKKKSGKSKETCAPTQAYTMEVGENKKSEVEPTVAYEMETEPKMKREETSSFDITDDKIADKSEEDRGLVPTQVFKEDEEEDEEMNAEDVSHLLTTPTLACDMEMEDEDSDSDLPEFNGDEKILAAETQAVGNDDATQAFEDPDEKVVKKTGKKQTGDDETQVVEDDATLAVSEASPRGKKKAARSKQENETQVIGDDDATVAVSDISPDDDATQVVAEDRDDDATQVVGEVQEDDATQVVGEGPDDDATQVVDEGKDDDATQVIGGDIATVAYDDLPKSNSEDATQVVGDDATQVISDIATQVIEDVGGKDGDDATQMFTDATLAAEDVETNDETNERSDNDATQVLGSDDSTLAATQAYGDTDAKVAITEDETQVIGDTDATVAITEDETQVVGDTDATVAVEEEVPAVTKGRAKRSVGRGKSNAKAETLPVEEPEARTGRGRRRTTTKAKETEETTVPISEDATMPIDETPSRSSRGKKKEMVTVSEPVVVSVSAADEASLAKEDEPQPRRGRGRSKADTGKPAAKQQPVKRGRGRPSQNVETVEQPEKDDDAPPSKKETKGRGKKSQSPGEAKDADVDKAENAKDAEAVLGEEATQMYGKDDDTDSEDSTLPVEDLVNMADVEDKKNKPSSQKKMKTKASPRKGMSSGESDLEPTQMYGLDEPEATQQYGLDTPDEEVIPESQGRARGRSPMIPLPDRSPHKSALASPRRSPSPSPKRVIFAPEVEDNENKTKKLAVGRGRGRRSLDTSLANENKVAGSRRRSLPAKGVVIVEPSKVGKGRGKGKTVEEDRGETLSPVLPETSNEAKGRSRAKRTEIAEEDEAEIETIPEPEKTKVTKGRGKKAKIVEKEPTEADVAETSTGRPGRSRGKKETVDEDKPTLSIETSVQKGRGRGKKETVEKAKEDSISEEKPEPTISRGRSRGKKEVTEKSTEESESAEKVNSDPTPIGRGRSRGKKEPVKETESQESPSSEKTEASASKGRGKKTETVTLESEVGDSVKSEIKGKGRKRSSEDVEVSSSDKKTKKNEDMAEEATTVRRGRNKSKEVEADMSKDESKKVEEKETKEESVPTRKRKETKSEPVPVNSKKDSIEAEKGTVTTGRRGKRNISKSEEKEEREDNKSEAGESDVKEEPAQKRGRRNVSVEKDKVEAEIVPSKRGRGRGNDSQPDVPEPSGRRGKKAVETANTVETKPADVEGSEETPDDSQTVVKRGRQSNVTKTKPESQSKEGKPEDTPASKGSKAAGKKKETNVGKADVTPRGRRGRSASDERSVSSRESSLDGSLQGRPTRGKKSVEPSPSTSRTLNKNSQESNEGGKKPRGRQSLGNKEEKETKGKVQAAKSSSQTSDETRVSARKRSSEESVDSPSKRTKKVVKETEETSDFKPVSRASKKDTASKVQSARNSKGGKAEVAEAVTPMSRSRGKGKDNASQEEAKVEEKVSKVTAAKRKKGDNPDDSQTEVSGATPNKKSRQSDVGSPKGKKLLKPPEVGSPSLRRKSMEPKPKVLFTGVVHEQGQKTVKDLGGELATSIHDCTHLVTDKVRRTVKFLGGLARGIPIVTTMWLDNCKSAGTFLDANKFLVSDPGSEKQHKFCLKKSLARASDDSMLSGYRVHVTKSVLPDPPQMKDILICAGAEYLASMPKKNETNTVVVSCDADKALCAAAIKSGIPVVSSEFILTGILRQEVDVDSFRLFAEVKASNAGKARSKTRR